VINWTTSRDDSDTIEKIAVRARQDLGYSGPPIEIIMDVTAVHANGCPLNLTGLLEADAFNFAHDIDGIRNHVDRETGQLTGGFLPRYSA
jgi:hypothetical protein